MQNDQSKTASVAPHIAILPPSVERNAAREQSSVRVRRNVVNTTQNNAPSKNNSGVKPRKIAIYLSSPQPTKDDLNNRSRNESSSEQQEINVTLHVKGSP